MWAWKGCVGSGNNGATNNSVKLHRSFFYFLAQSDKGSTKFNDMLKSLVKNYLNKGLGLSNTLLQNFPFQH